MLFYIAIGLLKCIEVDSMKLNSYDYIINEAINEEDYEMMSKDEQGRLNVHQEDKVFQELNNVARREYRKKYYRDFKTVYPAWITIPQALDYNNGIFIEHLVRLQQARHSPRKRDVTNTDTYYDYEHLFNEYDTETLVEGSSNKTYHVDQTDSRNGVLYAMKRIMTLRQKCNEGDFSFSAILCIYHDYRQQKQSLRLSLCRCWKIISIWILIYIIISTPLWCTRGLCCCCLICDFFKPHQTIEKAKKYLMTNPPGVMKTTRGYQVLYEPSRREKESYEEFEHLLRTI